MADEHVSRVPIAGGLSTPPVFDAASEKEFQTTVARYPNKAAATLPVLWIAQRQFGWLPQEVLEYVASRLELPVARVTGVASFYTMFKFRPTGKYHVQICRNLSCAMFGAERTTERVCKKLGIKTGGTTKDNLFTVEQVECLAACGIAPAVQVNEDFHGNMKGEKLDQLLEVLAEEAKRGGGGPGGSPEGSAKGAGTATERGPGAKA